MVRNKKLLVMDVEGTLFQASVQIEGTEYPSTLWQPIAIALGEQAKEEEQQTHEKWDRKDYENYMAWVRDTIEIHKKYGLKQDVFDALVAKAQYTEGVQEFFEELNRDVWIPVLISGGFQNLIRRAQNELNIEYGFGACEYIFDKYGYLEAYNLHPCDFDGKVKYLKNLLREYRLDLRTDWVFVGDGKNDVPIAKQAPKAFGIHPHKDLCAQVPDLIEIHSFMELLPYLKQMEAAPTQTDITPTSRKVRTVAKAAQRGGTSLQQQIVNLKRQNWSLKEQLNKKAGKDRKAEEKKLNQIPVRASDYENTSRTDLKTLLTQLRVAFIGLDEDQYTFRELSKIENLRVISGTDNNADSSFLNQVDFIFIYKDYASHSAINHFLVSHPDIPRCLLKEQRNMGLLQCAMANVLYRYIYKS